MLGGMKHTGTIALMALLMAACGEVRPTVFGDTDTPDASSPLAIVQAKPECPLLLAYVSEWQIGRFEETEVLHGFAILTNQGEAPVSLYALDVGYIGDTHDTVEIDASVESWLLVNAVELQPGQQAGFLVPGAEDVLGASIEREMKQTDNLFEIQIRGWPAAIESDVVVAAEIRFQTFHERLHVGVRFRPGPDTRPIAAAYACAKEN